MNVVIIEDERHNSRLLEGLVEKLRPEWEITAVLESIGESVEWVQQHGSPDLILMDIQLSDGICFSIFDRVKIAPTCAIVFTTAYNEYAIRAFKVNSIDYLLKPIEEDELQKAFRKFELLQGASAQPANNVQEQYKQLVESILSRKKEYRTRFLISGGNGYLKLDVKDVAYLYSENKCTFAVNHKGKEFLLEYNLEQLETELDPKQYFRANRKTILNIESVKKINNETGGKLVVLINPQPKFGVVVSRLKAASFKMWAGK